MYRVLAQFRVLICTVSLLAVGIVCVMFMVPSSLGIAGSFDDLMGQSLQRGTRVDAARSRKSAAEAGVRRAWSKFLPSVQGYGEYGANRNNALGRLNGLDRNSYNSSRYGVSASLPIYKGGSNYYGLKQARANAEAEIYSFQEAQQLLLLDTARAILGIIRDREIVKLQKSNRTIVGSIVRSTTRRFEGGEATRTDIELAKDQYTSVKSVYIQALDNLKQNEIEFKRLIGRAPGRLSLPKSIHKRLPSSLSRAKTMAEEKNPQLLAALMRSQAADHSLSASYSKFLPSVDLKMDYSEDRYHGTSSADESDFSVKLNFTIPLFQPDAFPAKDESEHVSKQRSYEARDARFTARAMAEVAWASYHTAIKRNLLSRSRIKAARAAAHGMRRELEAGQRTVLDVLNTQERLVQAKVQSANTKYEAYMAAHLLLSTVGELNAKSAGNVEYVSSAKKQRKNRNKNVDQTKWRLQKASISKKMLPTYKSKNLSTHKIADSQALDLPWLNKPISTASVKRRQVVATNFALPVMKPRYVTEQVVVEKAVVRQPVALVNKQPEPVVKLKVSAPQIIKHEKLVQQKTPIIKTQVIKAPVVKAAVVKKVAPKVRAVKFRELVVPELIAPELKAPELIAPESTVPEHKVPAVEVQAVKVPAVEVPASRVPALDVKAVEVRENKEPVIKSSPKVEAIKALAPRVIQPLKKVVPVKIEKPKLRRGIYSKGRALDDELATGSIDRKKVPGKNEGAVKSKAFAIHIIPLPLRKTIDDDEIITGSLRPTVGMEEYPDTMQNRFAVWWNKGVDNIIGASKGPKPVLVPLDKYQRNRSKEVK